MLTHSFIVYAIVCIIAFLMLFIFLMHPTHDVASIKHQRLTVDTSRMRGSNRLSNPPIDTILPKIDTTNDNDKHEAATIIPHEDVHKDLVKMTPPLHNIDTPVTPPQPDIPTHNEVNSLYKGVPVHIIHNNQPENSHFTITNDASSNNFPLLQKIYLNYKQDEFIAVENKHESVLLSLENNKPSLSQVSLVHQALRDGDICNTVSIIESLKPLYQTIDDIMHSYKVKSFIEYGSSSTGASSRASLSYGPYPFYHSIAKSIAELFPHLTSVFMEATLDKDTVGDATVNLSNEHVDNECKVSSLPSNLYVASNIPTKSASFSGNYDCLQVVTDFASFINGKYSCLPLFYLASYILFNH